MKRILYLCTGNACRSQMAEYWTRALSDPRRVQVESAGTKPIGVHPLTRSVMEEVGISMSDAHSKAMDPDHFDRWDLVITLCGDARESCPLLPPGVTRKHWPLPDPARASGTKEDILRAFREVRETIRVHVVELLREWCLYSLYSNHID